MLKSLLRLFSEGDAQDLLDRTILSRVILVGFCLKSLYSPITSHHVAVLTGNDLLSHLRTIASSSTTGAVFDASSKISSGIYFSWAHCALFADSCSSAFQAARSIALIADLACQFAQYLILMRMPKP